MARPYRKASYGCSGRSRRFPLGTALLLGLCCIGLYFFVRGLGDDAAVSPEPDAESLQAAPSRVAAPQDLVDSPGRGRLEALLSDLANDPAQMIEVRDKLNEMLRDGAGAELDVQIRKELSKMAGEWLFGPKCLPGEELCAAYQVRQDDLLTRIGQVNRVPWELLAQINGIANPRSLRIGQTLKVVRGPFHAFVSLSEFRMDIYLQGTYVRSFPVGLARPGKRTPVGTWLVKDRVRNAAWTDPDSGRTLKPGDPDYPLGPIWMPLEGLSGDALGQGSYGIHGTNEPDSIGTASSMGCVRLRNEDAETVFNLLMPGHSRVVIAR